jgi:undecaprenyl-diphosphatase
VATIETLPERRWGFQRGLRLTLALSAVAAWLAMMLFGGADAEWDVNLYRQLYAADDAVLARNARLLTLIGSWTVLLPVTIIATIFLAYARRMRAALLLIMVFGGRLMVELQKVIVDRDRPGVSPHLEAVSSTSFPSGHAANAMITFVAIALLLPVRQRNRAIAVGIGLALALQTGWSRVALGVHWPSDVLGGWAFATFWLMFCMRLASDRPEAEAISSGPKRGTLRGRASLLIRRRRKDGQQTDGDRARP